MKKVLILACLFLGLGTMSLSAQKAKNKNKSKTFDSGSVTYKMTFEGADAMTAAMFGDASMTLSFDQSGNNNVDIKMGMIMDVKVVYNAKKEGAITLMSIPMMGKNIAVEMDKAQLAEANEKQSEGKAPTITYDKKDTKKIAGYDCYRADIKNEDGTTLVVYVTDKIKGALSRDMQTKFQGLEGFPLEYNVETEAGGMTFSATEVKAQTFKAEDFALTIPDGYEIMTYEELMEMTGGAGTFGM